MKNLIDYIEECGEGCATPGNTLGMGNPMAPGESGSPGMPGEPGSEPIGSIAGPKKEKKNTSKRKKKVNEGVLDVEKNEDGMDKLVVIDWLKKVGGDSQAAKATVNDDFSISVSYGFYMGLPKGETIPDFIKFKEMRKLSIDCEGDLVIPDGFLPDTMDEISISNYHGSTTIKFETKSLDVEALKIGGKITKVELPKKLQCKSLDVSQCKELRDVKNLSNGVVKANFPTDVAAALIRKHFGFKGGLLVNGFGPY